MSRLRRRAAPTAVAAVLGAALAAGCSAPGDSTGGPAADPTSDGSTSRGTSSPSAAPEVDVGFTMLPQVAHTGAAPAPADAADQAMSAALAPAQEGRSVVLQRKTGGRWVDLERGTQDADGVVDFHTPATSEPATYRAVAPAEGDLPRVTSAAEQSGRWGDPDFTDEFSGSSLAPTWSDRLQGYSAEGQRRCSKADPRAVDVGDGVVRLSVIDDPDRGATCAYRGTEHAWRLNGHIGTQGTQSFTYGVAAARIKFQPRRGQHGSFWLQPASRAAEEGDAEQTGAEIDVIEWFGPDRQGGLASFIHDYPDDGRDGVTGRKVGGYLDDVDQYGSGWAERFHVFSVEWTPERYVFRIDGQETFRTSKGVSGREQFLILSLLSSDYELEKLGGDDNLPQTMEVDWVRYWEAR